MMFWIFITGIVYSGLIIGVNSNENCSENRIKKCTSLAEPMLTDPHLIFPDNMNDINIVCRSWSNFVDCIRKYIDKCFSKDRKDQFNSAVEPPIASVHQMCSISSYQTEYLQYAGCIKATVINKEHCGNQYAVLVSEVSQENVRKGNLCCAYHHFRTCVVTKTRMRCDGNHPEGIATRFSRQVLDKAFRFLQDQCLNYIPDTENCPMFDSSTSGTMNRVGEGRSFNSDIENRSHLRKPFPTNAQRGKSDMFNSAASTVPSSSPGSTASTYEYTARTSTSNSIPPVDSKNDWQMTPTENVESRTPLQSIVTGNTNDEKPDIEETFTKPISVSYPVSVEEILGPQQDTQRSSNYGRGISWTTTTESTSKIPYWATSTWFTANQVPTTDDMWYPAAGSFGGNNIDEPNQQGLSGNGQERSFQVSPKCILIVAAALVIM